MQRHGFGRIVLATDGTPQADVIVIGSNRLGNIGTIVLRSVTHDLVRETGHPVLVAGRA